VKVNQKLKLEKVYLKQPKKVVDFHFQTLFMKLRKAKESSINIQTAYCLNTLSHTNTETHKQTQIRNETREKRNKQRNTETQKKKRR